MKNTNKKQTKVKRNGLLVAAKATFILTIIGSIFAFLMAIAPFAVAGIGVVLFFLFVIVMIICSVFTAFMIWFSEGFRDFAGNFWSIVAKCFTQTDTIINTIKDIFPYVAGIVGAIVIAGFVVNLIAYLKNKDLKKQKSRFIATTILFGLSIVLIIIGFVFLYI